jgi:tetratricopeptide (TPR) repeat protein
MSKTPDKSNSPTDAGMIKARANVSSAASGQAVSPEAATLHRLKTAMALQIDGKLADAEKIYQVILDEQLENADANHLLGLIRSEQDDSDNAVALIQKAIRKNDRAAPFHHNIAGIYRRMGRLEDAEREFRIAISLKADYGEAYQGLGEMVSFDEGDPIAEQIHGQLANSELPPKVRCYFNFAAGKYYDDIGEYDRAFSHYTQGNRDANRPFDSSQFRQQIKDTIYVYGNACVRLNADAGDSSTQPTFIIGMPRSGTTLVEQILASHSRVFGAGELNEMKFVARRAADLSGVKQPYPNFVSGLAKKHYARLAEAYLLRLKELSDGGDYERIVDKHPLNFQFVGLILQLFPNAKIIHTMRNPLDTCLSCFFQNFTKGQDYSFDLVRLAHFFNDYRRLMEHWHTMYPGKILNIQYENVLENQEEETRRLLAFCGLPFEEACLEFHRTQRVVKTASFLQVRKPLYQTSRNRWRNYSKHLAEVARILGISIAGPVTITGSSLSGGST